MILSIETSTQVCSVALHQNGELVANAELLMAQSHSGMLTVMIDNVLRHATIDKKNLAAVAISKGPGSYTGLRIGTSTAKGLCYALDIPLLAVDTLESMAYSVSKHVIDPGALLCPMIDARRMEVYMALFDAHLERVEDTQAYIIEKDSFAKYLEERKVVLFGNGAAKCAEMIAHPNLHILEDVYPAAKHIGKLASLRPQQADVAYFEPYYLKDFMMKTKKSSSEA